MTQNISHAVMAQRVEPPDSLDFFPTPPWATRALCQRLGGAGGLNRLSCWDPAAGEGHMVRPLHEYFCAVAGTDCFDYGRGFAVRDFLFPTPPDIQPDWIITNPPFKLAAEFIETALQRARVGVAMLCRTALLEGGDRHRRIYARRPPAWVGVFSERVPMVKGRLDRAASSATSYAWFVWRRADGPPVGDPGLKWFPPGTRAALERDEDYP